MQDHFAPTSNIEYNTPAVDIWVKQKQTYLVTQSAIQIQQQRDQQKLFEKQRLVEKYLHKFDEIIGETLRMNNQGFHDEIRKFLFTFNLNQKNYDSQVPTSLVITSSESASSIETQFQSLCDELKKSTLQAINLVLDEKKCANLKSTIEHMIYKLKLDQDLLNKERDDRDDAHSDQEDIIKIPIDLGQHIRSDSESENEDPKRSTNHISSIRDGNLSYTMCNDSAMDIDMNKSLQREDIQMESINEGMSKLQVNGKQPVHTMKVRQTEGRMTRQKEKKAQMGFDEELFVDEHQFNKAQAFYHYAETNDLLLKESFYGFFYLFQRHQLKRDCPIVIIIKNIKTFPHSILNDLIHLFKKYRGAPYNLKLNLVLGVQNNNKDEFHLRVKIQNCVKMNVKTFYFPCMKNIIFEVIYQLIMSPKFSFHYDTDFIENIVETINLYGMSVMKFKRILRMVFADFFLRNELYFVHNNVLPLMSQVQFDSNQKKLHQDIKTDLDKVTYNKPEKAQELISMFVSNSAASDVESFAKYILLEIKNFQKQKRTWKKAYEVLENIIVSTQDIVSKKERNIFSYQFLINFLTVKNESKFHFIQQQLECISNYKEFVNETVIPNLAHKSNQPDKPRESQFIMKELDDLKSRLDGRFKLQRQISGVQDAQKNTVSLSKLSSDRIGKLLNVKKDEQMIVDDHAEFKNLTEQKKQEVLIKMSAKSEQEYKEALIEWLKSFYHNYLNLGLSKNNNKLSTIQEHLFFVKWRGTTQHLNPDIGGNMTKAIINSSKLLNCSCCRIKKNTQIKIKYDGSNIIDTISPTLENMTIMLELYKYFGKEFNLVLVFEIFKKINMLGSGVDNMKQKYKDADIRTMFLVALQNLKYMGYVSATKQNIFLFKKNFYGKPSLGVQQGTQPDNQENDKNKDNRSVIKK